MVSPVSAGYNRLSWVRTCTQWTYHFARIGLLWVVANFTQLWLLCGVSFPPLIDHGNHLYVAVLCFPTTLGVAPGRWDKIRDTEQCCCCCCPRNNTATISCFESSVHFLHAYSITSAWSGAGATDGRTSEDTFIRKNEERLRDFRCRNGLLCVCVWRTCAVAQYA